MLTKLIGRIVGLLLSILLIGMQLIMHIFIGVQVLLKANSATVIQGYLSNLAGYLNSSFFTEYYALLMKPLIRITFYGLVAFIIILIFVFNKWISLSLKEIGLVTFVAAIPFLLLSFGWISLRGIIPEASIEQYEKFFSSGLRNSSLIAIAVGVGIYVIGIIIREIERKIRNKKKLEIREQKLAEKQQRQEERKAQLKNLFGRTEEETVAEKQPEAEETLKPQEPEKEAEPEIEEDEPDIEEPVDVIEPVIEEKEENEEKPKEKKSLFSSLARFKYGKDPEEDESEEK